LIEMVPYDPPGQGLPNESRWGSASVTIQPRSKRSGISAAALREVGVSASVLRKAGL
jgi:hypothetical protein